MMEHLKNETRLQAVERYNLEGGNEADYIRTVNVEMADGTIEELSHCQICGAHLENGVIKHLFYCPFADERKGKTMLTPVDRVELAGDTVTIYRNWTPNTYRPSSHWLETVCELSAGFVNNGVAEVYLEPTGWYIDFRADCGKGE